MIKDSPDQGTLNTIMSEFNEYRMGVINLLVDLEKDMLDCFLTFPGKKALFDDGLHFQSWMYYIIKEDKREDVNNCSNSAVTAYAQCFLRMDRDKKIIANFKDSFLWKSPRLYLVTMPLYLAAKQHNIGSSANYVSMEYKNSHGQNITNQRYSGATSFNFTGTVKLTPVANEKQGWYFVGWTGDCFGKMVPCTVDMHTADRFVTAVFSDINKENESVLNLDIVGKGEIYYISPYAYRGDDQPVRNQFHEGYFASNNYNGESFELFYKRNTKVTMRARHKYKGWDFYGWGGDCGYAGNSSVCTITMDANKEVTIEFTEVPAIKGNGCEARNFSAVESMVQDLYIAYYGRPADVEGLAYWSGELNKGINLDTMLPLFGNSPEYQERFGTMDVDDLIRNLYRQLFNEKILMKRVLFIIC